MLSKKAREIDEYYKQRHNVQEVSQLKDFVKKLSGMKQEHNSLIIRI